MNGHHTDSCSYLRYNEDCVQDCGCGRGRYPRCRYKSCYGCFLDRRERFVICIICGRRWHSPDFDQCFTCRRKYRDDPARALRQLILHRDGYRCTDCGALDGELVEDPYSERLVGVTMQVDHIVPCARGGTADEWNLQALCGWHNRAKGALWYVGCVFENVKTALCSRYFLVAGGYFPSGEAARFRADVHRFRATGTWDPATWRAEGLMLRDPVAPDAGNGKRADLHVSAGKQRS